MDRPGQCRAGRRPPSLQDEEHHRRQSRQRLDAALFARWAYIAYRAQQRPGYESDRFRLMLYDRKTGEKKNLTEDFDRLGRNLRVGARFPNDLFQLPSIKAIRLIYACGPISWQSQRRKLMAGGYDDVSVVTNGRLFVLRACPLSSD